MKYSVCLTAGDVYKRQAYLVPNEHTRKNRPSLVGFMYILVSVLFKVVKKIDKQLMDDMN